MAWMSGMGPAPTDALLFTHCGDHGLNLYFESTSLVGQRSTIAAGNKTDKEGNVGAETPRLMIKPTRAYGISATANDYCRTRSSVPPRCRNWTLNVTPVTDRKIIGCKKKR